MRINQPLNIKKKCVKNFLIVGGVVLPIASVSIFHVFFNWVIGVCFLNKDLLVPYDTLYEGHQYMSLLSSIINTFKLSIIYDWGRGVGVL